MRFRLTPRETSFYDMFAASADNIVTGSKLLMEMLGADASARPRSLNGCARPSTQGTTRRTRSSTS
ncbi:phosphate transport regulator [Streptomyces noursei]|uniref:Phosphate transport regulator n=1 Tax=Streptomyces noursei TaxID=1971 RepID=A0A401QRD4_STRNR|nr:phosphate transport regulator [Streptomyces noursei]